MSFFSSKSSSPETLAQLPAGSFSVDSSGEILVGTVPSDWLNRHGPPLARVLVSTFAAAEAQACPLAEIVVRFAGLKVTARNLRGGALVFLAPLQAMDRRRS